MSRTGVHRPYAVWIDGAMDLCHGLVHPSFYFGRSTCHYLGFTPPLPCIKVPSSVPGKQQAPSFYSCFAHYVPYLLSNMGVYTTQVTQVSTPTPGSHSVIKTRNVYRWVGVRSAGDQTTKG